MPDSLMIRRDARLHAIKGIAGQIPSINTGGEVSFGALVDLENIKRDVFTEPAGSTARLSATAISYRQFITEILEANATYRIDANIVWGNSVINTNNFFELRWDGNIEQTIQARCSFASQSATYVENTFIYVTTSVATTHTIDIYWYSSAGNSQIQSSSIEIARVP